MSRAVLAGQPGSSGVASGHLLWVANPPAPASPISIGRRADTEVESARLMAALDAAASELDELARETADRAGAEIGEIFEAQGLFARDPGIVQPALDAIEAGAFAEEAIDRVTAEHADRLAGVDDAYFRERAADLRDVGRRVVDHLAGRARPGLHRRDGRPAILAADELDPSLVAALRPELAVGLAFAGGAINGHAAIVARALGIPLVLGLGPDLGSGLDGRPAILDADNARLVIDPDASELAELDARAGAAGDGAAGVGWPPETSSSGVSVEANVGSVAEAELAGRRGADGIGLVRTELIFLGRTTAPGLAEQRSTYRQIAAAVDGRPVVFRTLDVGGDKPAGFEPTGHEANPALGVRGIRLGLRRPDLFETQVRAIAEAVPGGSARILLPMVSTIDEIRAARAAIDRAVARSKADGAPVAERLQVGVMVEVPSLALMADRVAEEVDFLSIGTNDLVQYALAVDRTSSTLADLASPLQPAIVRLIAATCRAAAACGRPVAVCGEAAAQPGTAALFVGLGVRELSVAPAAIPKVRGTLAAIAAVGEEVVREAAREAAEATTIGDVRAIVDALLARLEAEAPAR